MGRPALLSTGEGIESSLDRLLQECPALAFPFLFSLSAALLATQYMRIYGTVWVFVFTAQA